MESARRYPISWKRLKQMGMRLISAIWTKMRQNVASWKILKRTEFGSIVDYAIKTKIEFVYIRSNHNANPFTIQMVKRMKKAGMKIVMEIPTYPYDQEYFNKSMRSVISFPLSVNSELRRQTHSNSLRA